MDISDPIECNCDSIMEPRFRDQQNGMHCDNCPLYDRQGDDRITTAEVMLANLAVRERLLVVMIRAGAATSSIRAHQLIIADLKRDLAN